MLACFITMIILTIIASFFAINFDLTNRLFGCNLLKNEVRSAIISALLIILLASLPVVLVKNCFQDYFAPKKYVKKK
jgi:hypothetical protein